MSIQNIMRRIPSYATDLKQNLDTVFTSGFGGLSDNAVYLISLSACYTLKHEQLINNFRNEAKLYLDDQYFDIAKYIAAIMSQNNTFYFFSSQSESETIKTAKIDLAIEAMESINIDRAEFELALIGVSILNRCSNCANYYAKKIVKRGFSEDAVLAVAKIVSVLKATSQVLEMEHIRSYEFVARGENI